MKHNIITIIVLLGIFVSTSAIGQEKTEQPKHKKSIVISNKGITITDSAKSGAFAHKDSVTNKRWGGTTIIDLGTTFLQDNTNYNDPAVKNYLNVPATMQNKHIFDLWHEKSLNVNISFLKTYQAMRKPGQRIYLGMGLGMQIYNFKFDNNITFDRNSSQIYMDTVMFRKNKNKIAINYLNVPFNVVFKTRIAQNRTDHKKDTWLVYGGGITAGYSISTWSKQISDERGKVKVHDNFNFARFNSCLTGEIGIEGHFRLFASYQLTNLYDNAIDQRPICIGLKIGGI